MRKEDNFSIQSQNIKLEEIQLKIQRVLLALMEVDLDENKEYLALAAIDLCETHLSDLKKILEESRSCG